MTTLINHMQEIFTSMHFISEENVNRYYASKGNKSIKAVVSSIAAVEPLERCNICTLMCVIYLYFVLDAWHANVSNRPPCDHIPLSQLEAAAFSRRAELPRYKGGLVCPEFLTKGRCQTFNRFKHCSMDHPPNANIVQPSPKRCSRCTLLWPCNHCSYSKKRLDVIDALEELQRRVALLKQMAVPNPPLALVYHLTEEFPDYKRDLARLKEKECTLEKERQIEQTAKWINTAYSTEEFEYNAKYKALIFNFQPLYASPLLRDTKRAMTPGLVTNNEGGTSTAETSAANEVVNVA